MSNTTTATAANVWTFAPDSVTVNGHTFPASYSLARSGDVYVFATVKAAADAADVPVRLHISATMPMHADAVVAAEAARKASKPAPVQEAPAPEAAPAPVSGKAWIGTTIQGKGWSIAFDADAGRTRVQVEGTPTDAQRSAIEQAGFYWSSQLKSWNKKLTCKAFRAAQALAATLNALA